MLKSLATARNIMHSAVQLAGFRYIVCLKATPTNADGSLKFQNAEFVFQNISQVENKTLHADFQRWAAAAVLRDLIESFSIFLTEIYKLKIEENPNHNSSITAAEFERKGLEDQLNAFADAFELDPRWIKTFLAFNRMRNCLAHRQGIVGLKDCNDGNHLVINWLSPKTTLVDSNSNVMIEDDGFMKGLISAELDYGLATSLKTLKLEKRFAVGTVLNFHPNEIFEICSTFQLATAAFAGK